jgi:DNA-binding transcriptional ArsR family regulator
VIKITPETGAKPIKEFEVISDIRRIKLLLDRTRADIMFGYLVHDPMTVKQLADAMGKKPGTVLHHVQKLKEAKLIELVRTQETPTGIIERYYRATAREYRLGISELMRSPPKSSSKSQDPVKLTLLGLSTIGISIPDSEMKYASDILSKLIKIEDKASMVVNRPDNRVFQQLPPATRSSVLEVMQRFLLSKNPEYEKALKDWHDFLALHINTTKD